MREIILKVPEAKFRFVKELIQNLGIEMAEGIEIPEAHKEIVRKRISDSNASSLVPWKESREKLYFKS